MNKCGYQEYLTRNILYIPKVVHLNQNILNKIQEIGKEYKLLNRIRNHFYLVI